MSHQSSLTTFIGAFVDELSESGIEDVVVSPGSRSTPISMLVAEHPGLKEWLNLDERSAAFFALGLAKAKRKSVALVCTSGTAVTNYFPAVVEAYYSRIPLVIITADRPHELREVGAPQAIDQLKIYGNYVKWFVDMPLPNENELSIKLARTNAGRAIAVSQSLPSGPVHLNFPLQEPLIPDLNMDRIWESGKREKKSHVLFSEGKRSLNQGIIQKFATELQNTEKGLIVVGPHEDPNLAQAVTLLANKLQFPIIADPLSQLRTGSHEKDWIIDTYDAFLREHSLLDDLRPELILRVGAMPVSKPFLQYLHKKKECRYLVIEEGSGWREPVQREVEMVYADPTLLFEQLASAISFNRSKSKWGMLWTKINGETKKVMASKLMDSEFFEGHIITDIQKLIPKQSTLFVGNSMPVRDLDSYFFNDQKFIRTMANRGANGIDGVVSTALGASVERMPLVLVIGDLSFFHDMNGLMAAKYHELNAKIVVVNNNGGGIFSFLPQAQSGKHFEELFGTPTDLNFSLVAELYKSGFHQVRDRASFAEAFKSVIGQDGLDIIEVVTNRTKNTGVHRQIWNDVFMQLKADKKD